MKIRLQLLEASSLLREGQQEEAEAKYKALAGQHASLQVQMNERDSHDCHEARLPAVDVSCSIALKAISWLS